MLPVTRNSVWLYVFGISYERAIKFHRWIAVLFVATVIVHGVLMGVYYQRTAQEGVDYIFRWSNEDKHWNLPGFIAGLTFVVQALFALWFVRRKAFELFMWTHMLFIVALVFTSLHNFQAAIYIAPGFALWLIDMTLRIVSFSRKTRLLSIRKLPGGIVEMHLQRKHFKFTPGQYVFLTVPAVSKTQSHPFSISSAPSVDGIFSLHAKDMGLGTFTHRLGLLADDVANYSSEELQRTFSVAVDGPYGRLSVPLDQYSAIVFLAGGIGVTPFASIFSHLANVHHPRLKYVHFVWAVKDSSIFYTPLGDGLGQAQQRFTCHAELNLYSTHLSHVRLADSENGIKPFSPTEGRPSVVGVSPSRRGRLAPFISSSRPSVPDILQKVKENSVAKVVAVLVCGPPSLMEEAEVWCDRLSNTEVRFHLHKETFLL